MARKASTPPKSIKVVPNRIQRTGLKVPELGYKVVAQPILKTRFVGNVITIPTVLIFYLHPSELAVVATIIQETIESGICTLTKKSLSIRLKMSMEKLSDALYHLRRMKIMYEARYGWHVQRAIDYDTVQHLNDLLENEDRGIYKRLRAKCRLKNVKHLSKTDLEKAYDKYVLPVDHDIEEEEEYD